MLDKLFNVFDDVPAVTTADIVIVVVISLVVLGIIAYFVYKKMNGKRISDCGCGSTDKKKLVKSYFKKYPKEKKEDSHHSDECCCGKH